MKPVLQVFQVDQCKHFFGRNSLDFITDHYQIWSNEINGQELLYASFIARKRIVTIAANAEVYNYFIFWLIEGKLGRSFFSTLRRTSTNLVGMVGCHGDMVTMAIISNLLLYSSKRVTSKFRKFLSWCQNFSVRLLRF